MSVERPAPAPARITVVYNNVPHTPGLRTAWGFAAVVESGGHTLLFDTGGDGRTLLANMERLNIDPATVEAVALSHAHGDHTGGLETFLEPRPGLTVFGPAGAPSALRRVVERREGRFETVDSPRRLLGNLYSTGTLGHAIPEQALIVDAPNGLALITGCAHPDVVAITERARAFLGREVDLVMGGFHLLGRSRASLLDTATALRSLGVRRVAPSHCTGEEGIAVFREQWGLDFVEGGCGAVIEVQ